MLKIFYCRTCRKLCDPDQCRWCGSDDVGYDEAYTGLEPWFYRLKLFRNQQRPVVGDL